MDAPVNLARRKLLSGKFGKQALIVRPPGATDEGLNGCTGCGDCVDICPTHILRMEEAKPIADFSAGECLFCGQCASACKEAVFDAEKASFAHRADIGSSCLAQNGVSCQSCRDSCPENAIAFRPRIGGPFYPVLNEVSCTGCGACVSVCPVSAIGVAERHGEHVYG